jgi:hypothetical protein
MWRGLLGWLVLLVVGGEELELLAAHLSLHNTIVHSMPILCWVLLLDARFIVISLFGRESSLCFAPSWSN